MKLLAESLRSIVLSYSELFFLKNIFSGLIFVFITFLNPAQGIAGLVAISSSYALAVFIGHHKEFLNSGYYTYNSLLVGLSISQIFSLSPISVLFIIIAALVTFLLTVALSDIFGRYFSLPVLSTPFVIVTSIIYLSAPKFSNLYSADHYLASHVGPLNDFFPLWLNGLFKSMGAILFMPNPAIGMLILCLIMVQSRILFFLAVAGYYAGTMLEGTFVGSYASAFSDLNAFNYPLIAMALGAVFNIPSVKSYVFAFSGVAMATVVIKSIDVFWAEYGIPVFTLPFVLITFTYVYVLKVMRYKLRPTVFKSTPEETAEFYYTQQVRYPEHTTMYLPFTDYWTVYQGFDGPWTHKGIWSYAYDFVKIGTNGLSYSKEGRFLEDYFCYRQPVCSPCRGVVVFTSDLLIDNPIGVVDTINNWGNYVIIKDYRGYYVSLCHLAKASVCVKAGDWVEIFQQVALCGNSGYSPQPHIHMQYQVTAYLSSPTIPFSFVALQDIETIYQHLLPPTGRAVRPIFLHKFYLQTTNFILDELLRYKVYKKDSYVEDIEFKVSMALDGSFYLARKNSRLFFGEFGSTFYFYNLEGTDPYLRMLFQALPSLPLSYVAGVNWKDVVSDKFFKSRKHRFVSRLENIFLFDVHKNATYHYETDTTIAGSIEVGVTGTVIKTKLVLDPYYKFRHVEVENYTFVLDER